MSLQFSSAAAEAGLRDHAGESGRSAPVILEASDGGTLVVPGGSFLLTADYARHGGDLVLTGTGDEPVVVIRDFFKVAEPPQLETEAGARIDGELAVRLAGSPTPGQYAAAEETSSSEPIGKIAEITGEATITRLDGTKLTLARDVPVFQGDLVETGSGAALKVVFIDDSTFAVGENGRMVLDELVFDPATLEGASKFSVLEGVFVFVSGGIAENNPDQMVVKTPVATMGIRGTAVAVQAAAESEENLIILLSEKSADGQETSGSVKVTTDGGSVVLDEPNEATALDSIFALPSDTFYALPEDIAFLIRRLQNAVPDSLQHLRPDLFGNHAGEHGKPEQTAQDLSEISPAAGGPEHASDEVIHVTNGNPLADNPFSNVPPPAGLLTDFGAGPGGSNSNHDEFPLILVKPPIVEAEFQPTPPPPDFILPGGLFKLAQSVDPHDVLVGGVLHTSGPLGASFVFQEAGTYLVAWGAMDEGDFIIDSPLLLDNVFLNDKLLDGFDGTSFKLAGFQIPTGSDVTFVGNFNGVDPIEGAGQLKFDDNNISAAQIQTLLGLPAGALTALSSDGNPNTIDIATHGSVLLLELTVAAGDVLSFSYDFVDSEVNGGPGANFNDFAYFFVNAEGAEGSSTATSSNDVLFGSAGNDQIDALAGNDTVFGSSGNDTLIGNAGDDTLFGGAGNDALFGNDGNDKLFGGAGDDLLNGGNGANILSGGTGVNVLTGGPDADAYFFQSRADGIDVATNQTFNGQATQVTNFQHGTDKFVFQNTEFGFDIGTKGSLADIQAQTGKTLFSTISNYDGTGVTQDPDKPHFIFDPAAHTLYFDANVTAPGYTVVAEVQNGATVSASDIQISAGA